MLLYCALIINLSILSMRISSFVMVCGRVLAEVGLFLMLGKKRINWHAADSVEFENSQITVAFHGWTWLNMAEPCWTMLNHVEPCWTYNYVDDIDDKCSQPKTVTIDLQYHDLSLQDGCGLPNYLLCLGYFGAVTSEFRISRPGPYLLWPRRSNSHSPKRPVSGLDSAAYSLFAIMIGLLPSSELDHMQETCLWAHFTLAILGHSWPSLAILGHPNGPMGHLYSFV